mmetsp:Transcript_55908/g.128403  ORF Transcript_55908/g.128403 Transcript_55908/m.128403 type:complete len:393 (-) Transcript_55908:288-1466(-)
MLLSFLASVLCLLPSPASPLTGVRSTPAGVRKCKHPAAQMLAKKAKVSSKRKGKPPMPSKISLKGFGAVVPKIDGEVGTLLTDAAYERLREWLVSEGANLARVGIADFSGLRGVIALQEIKEGEEIVSIPAKCAVDLGVQGDDPVPPALRLLSAQQADNGEREAYWKLLPQPDSADLCTPDFFSEKELQMLQWPPLIVGVRRRSAALRQLLGSAAPTGDTPREEMAVAGGRLRQLKWSVWLVLSRVLTVLGPDGSGHKLLIPFIDMFNHKASSRHFLSGRTDGRLRVVAGRRVAAGEQIHIVYGTEVTSNAELLGHYGFVDSSALAADRRLLAQHAEAKAALAFSTPEEDNALLSSTPPLPPNERLALRFRLALKRAAVDEAAAPRAAAPSS